MHDTSKIFNPSEVVIQFMWFSPLQPNRKRIPIKMTENCSVRKVTLVRRAPLAGCDFDCRERDRGNTVNETQYKNHPLSVFRELTGLQKCAVSDCGSPAALGWAVWILFRYSDLIIENILTPQDPIMINVPLDLWLQLLEGNELYKEEAKVKCEWKSTKIPIFPKHAVHCTRDGFSTEANLI